MSKDLLRELFVLSTRETLASQKPDGDLGTGSFNHLPILTWAVCYSEAFPSNPFHHDRKLLDAIVRFGDFNCASMDDNGNYSTGWKGWDEWRTLAWMEATQRLGTALDSARQQAWMRKFIGAAKHVMTIIPDEDTFDGFIPNHPVWDHVLLYRVGQLFGVEEYKRHAAVVLDRVMDAQLPDGCWREGGTHGGIAGTPVNLYSLVSASAMDAYHSFSGNARAAEAVGKAWRWFYDFLLPDFSMPPTLDIRCVYSPVEVLLHVFPAFFFNQPEGRFIARRALQRFREKYERSTGEQRNALHRGLAFLALQSSRIREDLAEHAPQWPEYHRMVSGEAGIRRRNGWTVVLSGLSNRFVSNVAPQAFFGHERQDCVCVFHEKLGLLAGSSHSKMQEELSSFVFYENGRAQYLHDHACLKGPPALDTLLLQYGSNAAAVSADTTKREQCETTFSIQGERGLRTQRGPGYAMSAMGAKAHLSLRLAGCEKITLGGRSWSVERGAEERLCLSVTAGEALDFGKWKLVSPDAPWEFRWPVRLSDPYSVLSYTGERLGIAEVILYSGARPTATFRFVVP